MKETKKDNLDRGSINVPSVIINVNVKTSLNSKVTGLFLNGIFYSSKFNFRSIYPKEVTQKKKKPKSDLHNSL